MTSNNSFDPVLYRFQQSPIDLSEKSSVHVSELKDWLKIQYLGKKTKYQGELAHDNFTLFRQPTVKDDPFGRPANPDQDARPRIEFRGRTFFLSKIHLHHGTEHDVHGIKDSPTEFPRSYEVHLLHETFEADYFGPKVVIATYAREDDEPSIPEAFMQLLVSRARIGGKSLATSLRPADFLRWTSSNSGNVSSARDRFYHYEGSLTSPPFLETVSWIIFPHYVSVHTGAFVQVAVQAHQDQRPVQERHRRFVLRSFVPSAANARKRRA